MVWLKQHDFSNKYLLEIFRLINLFRQKHGVQMAWKTLVCAPADCWWNWGRSQCWYCQFTWSRRWRSASDKRWVACSDRGLHPSWLRSYCQCRWVRRLLLSLSWISLWCLWKDQEGTCTMESGGKKDLWNTVEPFHIGHLGNKRKWPL